MRSYPLLFVATIVLAAQGCGPTTLAPTGAQPPSAEACKDAFTKLDLNGDGALTDTEYIQGRAIINAVFPALATATDNALVAHLKGMDANRDGKVTLEEFVATCTAKPDPRPSDAFCVDCAALTTLDADKNGTVSFEEYFLGKGGTKESKDKVAAAFKLADLDGDGRLTNAELCGPNPSPSPSVKPEDPCREFLALDQNDDGKIGDEEYFLSRGGTQATKEALYTEFRGRDTNGDGVLTPDEICGPSPKPSESAGPTASPTVRPTDGPTEKPTDKPSEKPTDKPSATPSPSASPTDDCATQFTAYDTNGDGKIGDEEYFVGVGGTQATKNQVAADFKTRDKNGDGFLSREELCETPWPRTATVNIYGPMQPFGPQSVDIAVNGTVTFANVNSGVAWTIRSVGTPSFPDVALPTSPSTATTVQLTAPGDYEYEIDGTNPIVVHGHIIVH